MQKVYDKKTKEYGEVIWSEELKNGMKIFEVQKSKNWVEFIPEDELEFIKEENNENQKCD